MRLESRLRRIEQRFKIDAELQNACALCQNGTKRVHVVQTAGHEPFTPLPTCPGCGRCIASVVRIVREKPAWL